MDSITLDSVRNDVNTTLVLFRTIHGTLNSVLSRVGSLTETVEQANKLHEDCAHVESALTVIQRRLATGDNVDNQHQVDNDAASQISRATANNSVDANTPRTFAAVVASPAPPKPHAHTRMRMRVKAIPSL